MNDLTRGQASVLAAAAVPMIGAGCAGGYGTYTNITTEVGRSETALGVVAAGEGLALVLALLVVGLTMLGQSIPAVVRTGLWGAPVAAAGTGIATADSLTEAIIYAITPMAMSGSAEALGLLARRIVVHRTGTDAEAQRRNAETVQRLAYLRARSVGHPNAWVRRRSERAAWRLVRRVGVGDAHLGMQLVDVQRTRLRAGADAALADMLAAAPASAALPAPYPAHSTPAPGFDAAADEAAAAAQPLVLDIAPMLPASVHVRADAHPVKAPTAPASGAAVSDAHLIEAARALAATGPLSLRRLQRELGIGQARAQRIRDALDGAA